MSPRFETGRNSISAEDEAARSAREALVEYFVILSDWDASQTPRTTGSVV
jgi:hypothetical protein